jgi:hypothetical protein
MRRIRRGSGRDDDRCGAARGARPTPGSLPSKGYARSGTDSAVCCSAWRSPRAVVLGPGRGCVHRDAAGMAVGSRAVGRLSDRFGRHRGYVVLLVLLAFTAAVFALTPWWPLLVLAALTGTLSTDPKESGPIATLEQAMIGAARATARAGVFGLYNAIAYLAGSCGALLAGGSAALRDVWPGVPVDQRWCSPCRGWRWPRRAARPAESPNTAGSACDNNPRSGDFQLATTGNHNLAVDRPSGWRLPAQARALVAQWVLGGARLWTVRSRRRVGAPALEAQRCRSPQAGAPTCGRTTSSR